MRSLTRVAFWLAVVVALSGGIGWAASIAVTTFDPAVAPDGSCSLIEAMENANADAAVNPDCVAGAGPDSIELAEGVYVVQDVHNEVHGPSGLPAVSGILTINGNAAVIERARNGPLFRLFLVTEGARLTLNHLTIGNGMVEEWRGGGLFNVGGTVALVGCTVVNNEAHHGGGLANRDGSMVLLQTVVNGNRSTRNGGGLENRAAGGDATMVVFQSTVSSNTAEHDGGGLSNAAATGHTASLKLVETAVSVNHALRLGGAVAQFGEGAAQSEPKVSGGPINPVTPAARMELRVVAGEISDNQAGKDGGGIAAWVWPAGAWASQVDISGGTDILRNEALHGSGGGLLAWYAGALLAVSEADIDGNIAADGRGGGIAIGEGAALVLSRSTVSHNVADGIVFPAGAGGGIEVTGAGATITESTISGNRALAGGGGMEIAADANNDRKVFGGAKGAAGATGALVSVADTTIVDNEAGGHGGGVAVVTGSGTAPAELRMVGSILGHNVDRRGSGNCRIAYPAVFNSEGNNFADDATCWLTSAPDGSGGPITGRDVVVADLMLDALAANGGPTSTHMPLDGSPVIDVGTGAGMRSYVDQRGYPRVAGGGPPGGCVCDAGSVEKGSAQHPVPAITDPPDN